MFFMLCSFEIYNEVIKVVLNVVVYNWDCILIVFGVGVYIVVLVGNVIILKLVMCKYGMLCDNFKFVMYICIEGSFDCKCMGVYDYRFNVSLVLRFLLCDIDSFVGCGVYECVWVILKVCFIVREYLVILRLLFCDVCVEELLFLFYCCSE